MKYPNLLKIHGSQTPPQKWDVDGDGVLNKEVFFAVN